jgi:GNAT superfamily N-acetyltransferase
MIRPARVGDVSTIHALIRELARYEKLEHEAVATEEQIRASLFGPGTPQAEVLVAEPDEAGLPIAPVGFALFFHNYSTFLGRRGLYLEDLFVMPEHRRRGYGTALLGALARLAVERGCGRFEWAVLDWNEAALRFYRSLGAQQLSDWRICRVTGDALSRLAATGYVGHPGPGTGPGTRKSGGG